MIKMTSIDIILVVFISICFIILALYSLEPFIRFIYNQKRAPQSIEEAISIIELLVNLQITAYENDIFNTKGAITNANFDNFYNDLVDRVLETIPNEFFNMVSPYMTQEAVITIICKTIKTYLVSKIN